MPDNEPNPNIGALRDLLRSEGWQLLKTYAAEEWGPAGYGRQMQRALATVPAGPERAYEIARIAEQVDATAAAVNGIVKWPQEELHRLEDPPKPHRPFANLRRSS